MSFTSKSRKKSYSPARKITLVELPKAESIIRMKRYKETVDKKPSNPICTPMYNASKATIFRPKLIREVFLVEPSEINRLMETTRRLRSANQDNLRLDHTKLLKIYNNKLRETPKKLQIFVDQPKDRNLKTENFFKLIKNNSLPVVKKILFKNPDIAKETDGLGMTGLHWAIKRNLLQMARLLISSNCPIDSKDILGRTVQDMLKDSSDSEMHYLISEAILKNQITNSTSKINP